MIRIDKSGPIPRILSASNSSGVRETKAMCDKYDAGGKDFDFKPTIYGASSVKSRLLKVQHDKCAFCEAKVTHIAFGDVEHFRPKGGFVQSASDQLTKPGYYWLAYNWSNLFASCQICNQRFKRNHFPLVDSTKRARSHSDDLTQEQPIFLHPEADDPESHIEFHAELPRPKSGSFRGEVTIATLGLDRPEICEDRRLCYQKMDLLIRSQRVFQRIPAADQTAEEAALLFELTTVLDEAVKPSAEYSSMVKSMRRSML